MVVGLIGACIHDRGLVAAGVASEHVDEHLVLGSGALVVGGGDLEEERDRT